MCRIVDVYDLLRREEGLRLDAYQDSCGVWTIGYGHVTGIVRNQYSKIDAKKAEELLGFDIDQARRNAQDIVWPYYYNSLSDVRQGVMISMAYQLGIAGLCGFVKMLSCVRDGDWRGAKYHMLDSAWAVQTPARARRHGEMMLFDRWPKIVEYL